MKKDKIKDLFLEQIRKIPIIQVACEKVGIARSSVYRWRNEDEEFYKKLDEALLEGETRINEMSQTQLISLIQEKSWPAISFWLRHRDPKFKERIEINANIQSPQNELTPEQEAVVREALRFASLIPEEKSEENNQLNNNEHDTIKLPTIPGEIQLQPPASRSGGANDKKS